MIPAVAGTSATGGGLLPYMWVSVGTSGSLYTSTSSTASSWTSRTSSFGTTAITDVCTNKLIWVAVGGAGKIATSTDGITWTQRTSGTANGLVSVAYGNGYFVAVYPGGYIYSTDGITWSAGTSLPVLNSVERASYGNNLWVFSDPGIYGPTYYTGSSPTGTLTARTTTLQAGNMKRPMWFPAGSIWVNGADSGTTGAFESSPDGITWTARTSPNSQTANSFLPGCNSSVLVVWYRTGASTQDVLSSTNGTTYTDRTPAESSAEPSIYGFCATDDTGLICYVPGVTSKNVQTTTDGTTWTSRGTVAWTPNSVCHSNGVPGI